MFSKRINQFLFFTFLFFILSCSKSSNNAIPNDHGEVNLVKSYNFFETQGEVAPYISNNPFSEALSRCVYAIKDTDSCTPNELPLLGMNQKEITVEDILSRTLVSHQFLGDSFKEILMILPKDLLPMFGSVNAIVISNKINPSFFYRKSAAIYLSANLFWRNQEEKKISTIAVDKREGMGFELQFLFDYNYLINGKSIFELNSTKKSERSYDVLKYSVARLLFHELTHANDYYAKNFYSSADFDNTKTFAAISYDHYVNKGLVSSRLPSYANSKLMDRIVAITNDGETSTDEDLLITPKDVSDEFKKDVVNDDYSYVTQLEDAAMLMEETLMLYYFNSPRYVYIIKFPSAHYTPDDNFTWPIKWGQKSRVMVPNIRERADFVMKEIFSVEKYARIHSGVSKYSAVEISEDTPWNQATP